MRTALFLALLFFPGLALAQQTIAGPGFGWVAYSENGGTNTDSVNAAASWYARGFQISDAKTLSVVRLYCTAKTGTPASTDIHVMLYATDTATGGPVTGTGSTEDKTLSATPTCPGWIEATGFTTALTARTQYYIVVKNTHGTPASNYVTFARVNLQTDEFTSGYNSNGSRWGWNFCSSSDSGATWSAGNCNGDWAGMRLAFNDSSYAGMPLFEMNEDAAEARGTQEVGVKFVVPSDGPGIKVRGASMIVNWNGTPPTQLRYRLYTGSSSTPTLLATSDVVNDEHIQGSGNANWLPVYFSSAQTIAAGTTVRLVAGTPSGGSSGNAWTLNRYKGDTDSNSLPLFPYSNTLSTTTDGTTFSETSGTIVPFALLLDTTDPYDMPAAGSVQRASKFNRPFD